MNYRYLYTTILFTILLGINPLYSQQNSTNVAGKIVNAETGNGIPAANIILKRNEQLFSAVSNDNGNYEVKNIPFGIYTLQISSIGFRSVIIHEFPVEYNRIPPSYFELQPSQIQIDEVVIKAGQDPSKTSSLTHEYILTQEEVRRFPATFYDPARLATVYPGVNNDNDQANNLSIRGNTPNNMNYYIYGTEIVNPNHLSNAGTITDRSTVNGGGVNMISAQLLKNSSVYTGVLPVKLSQATSGGIDFAIKEGARDQMHFTGQAGLNGIDLAIEGPAGENLSYIANYRYSTVGLLTQLGVDFGDEAINYQDLSLQFTYTPNEKTKIQFFGMGGTSSNIFEAKVDSLRETYKDLQNIEYESKLGIIGFNASYDFNNSTQWVTTFAVSGREDQRFAEIPISSFETSDHAVYAKYALTSSLHQSISSNWKADYGISFTGWGGKLLYTEELSSTFPQTDVQAKSFLLRPFASAKYIEGLWSIDAGIGLAYNQVNKNFAPEPRLGINRYMDNNQKLSFQTGLQHKLKPFQVLLSTPENTKLKMLQSWKSTLSYKKDFDKSSITSSLFYENINHAGVGENSFSTLNILEQYPPGTLTDNGKGRNYGAEVFYNHFLNGGLFYMLSASVWDAKFKNPQSNEWKNTRYNNQYMFNGTIGKEFDFSDGAKEKILGINIQLVYTGGFWSSPIDLQASRQTGKTEYVSGQEFTIQQPDIIKTYFRVYYKINHNKRYSMIGLDLSNVINRQNLAYKYYDPYLDTITEQYQLGLIPMLSYVLRL